MMNKTRNELIEDADLGAIADYLSELESERDQLRDELIDARATVHQLRGYPMSDSPLIEDYISELDYARQTIEYLTIGKEKDRQTVLSSRQKARHSRRNSTSVCA